MVVCAYADERWDDLRAAVESVRRQTVAARDIAVVVDQNPALLARVHEQLDGVIGVANAQRPGLAGARNTGVEATSGEVVAFLDDDARAEPTWLAELQAAYRRPSLLGVGGALEPVWATGRPAWFPPEFDWVVGCTYRGVPPEPAPVRNPIGANMSVLRFVLEETGGFRPELGRLEETDFCIRAAERFPERHWLHWPAARVLHSVTPQRQTWGFFVARCHNEGLAKATMVRARGRRAGLSSERRYVQRTLPAGVARNLRKAARGDGRAALRAGAIVAGLGATGLGYAKGAIRDRRAGDADGRIPRRGATP